MNTMTETALTPDQVLRVADAHLLKGIKQHDLAALMGINSGRIAEACVAMKWAIANHGIAYRIARGEMQVTTANEEETK